MDSLTELVYLLTCRQVEGEDLAVYADAIRKKVDDPYLEWIEAPAERLQFGVRAELHEWIATSDKIDELHEQISVDFEDPLPPFPHERGRPKITTEEYFRWVDGVLAARKPGYDMLLWDCHGEEDLFAFVVYQADVERIFKLAAGHGLSVMRAVESMAQLKQGRAPHGRHDAIHADQIAADFPVDDDADAAHRREVLQAIALKAESIRICAHCGPVLNGPLPRPDIYLDGVMTNAILFAIDAHLDGEYRELFPKALQIQDAMRDFLFDLGNVSCHCD